MAKNEKPSTGLTDRENQVLTLITDGYSTIETAEKLGLSPRTVEAHRARIMLKTDEPSFVGLVKYAIKNNITNVNIFRGETVAV